MIVPSKDAARGNHARTPSPLRTSGLGLLQILVALAALATIGFALYQFGSRARSHEIHYPYWCSKCKAVFDVAELKKGDNWQVPPGASSDSVVICLRCREGWAFPSAQCYQCGTVYLMHRWAGSDCPKCHPEIAKAAAEKGIDLSPPELR